MPKKFLPSGKRQSSANRIRGMKKLTFLAAGFLCATVLFAQNSEPEPAPAPEAEPKQLFFNWSLLWSGLWEAKSVSISDDEESSLRGTLHNRWEAKLDFLPPSLTLRFQVLDRRALDFDLDPPWNDPEKTFTNFTGGLYHKPTGSRLLYGVLDEWGLSARIRNPWIRSPPYAENHKPLMADLKTAASSTKEDEAYLYLSSPVFNLPLNLKLRGFTSVQTTVEEPFPAFSGGVDLGISKKTGILLEVFHTQAVLPETKSGSWFSDPPRLPERDFMLYAAGILYYNPNFSVSSDFAYSETFAWGADTYANLGICVTPKLPFGKIDRPLSFSFAIDEAGERFVYRDGADHGEGFRIAGKIELKGKRSSLFRVNTVLRAPGAGEEFNRSSSGIYYRFPAANKNSFPVRLTRISLTADRNASNLKKISDGLSGNMGFSIKLPQAAKIGSFGVNFSGSVKGLTSSEDVPSPYPIPDESIIFDSASAACELLWSFRKLQLKTKWGYTTYAEKEDKYDFSFSAAARFKYGRLSLKAASEDFPDEWSWTVSWRLEKPLK